MRIVKTLHAVSAVIELGAGLALLVIPSPAVTLLLGVALNSPVELTVARVGGAGLLSLGVACWMARGEVESGAARGIVVAMLFYNVAAAGILAFAGISYGLFGFALWPAVLLHTLMFLWCLMWLQQGSAKVTV